MSKTERRRIAKAAKKAKKLAEKGGVADAPAASASRGEPNSLAQAKKAAKQGARLTHEERKHIYTERARIRREQQRAECEKGERRIRARRERRRRRAVRGVQHARRRVAHAKEREQLRGRRRRRR